MRYAIISDIHSNLEALNAVLEALKAESIDEYISLGDVVGYGADPMKCLDIIRELKPKFTIAGNHDRGTTGQFAIGRFNEWARDAIRWTQKAVDEEALNYLRTFNMTEEASGATFVHGSLESPEDFNYIVNIEDAYRAINIAKTDIVFVGHSHCPEAYIFGDGLNRHIRDKVIEIEEAKGYIINVGSVGQPRDRDNRASCAVYDTDRGLVEIKRISYNIESAAAKILEAGLPHFLAERLASGR